MFKIPFLCIVLLLISAPFAAAKFHEFKSADGRVIRAEVLRFTPNGLVIRREDGSQFDLKLDMLSQKSLSLIDKLKKEFDLSRIDSIQVSASTNRESKDTKNSGGVGVETSTYEKRIRIRRPRDLSLDGLTVKYMIFLSRDSDNPQQDIVTGTERLSDPDPSKDLMFKTNKYRLIHRYLLPGYYWTNSKKNSYEDDDLGIWVKIFDGDKEIFQYSNPSGLQRREKWNDRKFRR